MFPKPQQKSFSSSSYMLSLIQYQFYSHNDFKKFRCHVFFTLGQNIISHLWQCLSFWKWNILPSRHECYAHEEIFVSADGWFTSNRIQNNSLLNHCSTCSDGIISIWTTIWKLICNLSQAMWGSVSWKKSQRGLQSGAKCRIQERYSFWRFWVSGNPKILLCLWFSRF